MADLTPEENIDLMTKVMSNPALHINAAKAYKHTGTTNAFDGTEDDIITGDAKVFWDELDMRHKLKDALQEIEDEWHAGNLRWNFKTVMSLIEPYPKRRKLHKWTTGRDDEATPDPDPLPYLQEEADGPQDCLDPHWVAQRDSGAGGDRGSGDGDQSGGIQVEQVALAGALRRGRLA